MAKWNERCAGNDEPPIRDVAHVQCYHPYRQVGVDENGRPVFHNAFSQCNADKHVDEDFWPHLQHMLENAYKTFSGDETGFVRVIDYTGYSFGIEPLANSCCGSCLTLSCFRQCARSQ